MNLLLSYWTYKKAVAKMILSLLLFHAATIQALPQGAPTTVCRTLMPFHGGGIPAQTGLPPYSISPRVQGEGVLVSVGSNLGVRFQGLMLQARTQAGEVLGSFQVQSGSEVHMIDCAGASDTLTHNSPSDKDLLSVVWVPPQGYAGPVVFNSTVAQNYNTFWVGIESPPIQVSKRDTAQSSFARDPFYRGCGTNKYCLGAPAGCIDSENCRAAVAVSMGDDYFDFEMKADSDAVWVGAGLSNDNKMGDDSVIECVRSNTGRVEPYMSWTSRTPFAAARLSNPNLGIQLLNATISEDGIYCKVRRNAVSEVNGVTFDLKRNAFYVLIASGSELKGVNSVGFHDLAFLVSPQPESLSGNPSAVLPNIPELTTPPHYFPEVHTEASSQSDPIYEGCGANKLCFGAPTNCVKTRSCKAVTAVVVNGDKYDFELKANGNAAWVGVGLSDDDKMGQDSVIECVKSGNRIVPYMSWTTAKPYSAQRLSNPRLGIELISSTIVDDTIYCKVRRNALTTVNGVTFDLVSDKFNVLVAAGSTVGDTSVGYHNLAYLASAEPQALSDVSEVEAASKLLIRLHGSFMLAAWIGTASLGMLLARYYRQTWVGTTMMGKDLWFAWHRVLMVLTWGFTMVAFVLIFVELKAWSVENNPHAILGTITTILCFFQPIGAYFRPHPGTSKRSIFNWAHWLIGNAAHIIAIVTLFFAVKLSKAELPVFVDYILVVYVVVHVVSHLVLSLMNCLSEKSLEGKITSFPMKDMPGRGSAYDERSMDAPLAAGRKLVLGLYIVIIVVLTVALIVVTALAPIETTLNSIIPASMKSN